MAKLIMLKLAFFHNIQMSLNILLVSCMQPSYKNSLCVAQSEEILHSYTHTYITIPLLMPMASSFDYKAAPKWRQ